MEVTTSICSQKKINIFTLIKIIILKTHFIHSIIHTSQEKYKMMQLNKLILEILLNSKINGFNIFLMHYVILTNKNLYIS